MTSRGIAVLRDWDRAPRTP